MALEIPQCIHGLHMNASAQTDARLNGAAADAA